MGAAGFLRSLVITKDNIYQDPGLACDLNVAPAAAHLILRPAGEVGQLLVSELLDGELVDVALPAVHVALVMAHLLFPPPGQVIPGHLRDISS